MSKNVLTEFKIDPHNPTFLKISCRPAGVLAWILSLLKLVATTTMIASRQCLDYRSASLKGFTSLSVPLNKVTGVQFGIYKPIKLLIAAGVLFLSSLYMMFDSAVVGVIMLLVAIGLVVKYFLNKTFFIGFMNGGDTLYSIQFYSSVIENIAVDQKKVEEAASLIRSAILHSGH